MQVSIFIARILAVMYLLIGLGMLLDRPHYKRMMDDFLRNAGLLYVGALLAFVMGYLVVYFHNNWVSNWTVIVTVIGWLALLKGVLLLVFPTGMLKAYLPLMKEKYLG